MSIWDVVIRVVVAALLGGAIGIEREIREHTAGFRTHILVGVGAAAFTVASYQGVQGLNIDPTRIASGIVTGIGFLGAGAIIRYGASVRGLTTAASLWAVAALGLLTAEGFFSAALVTTGLVIVILYALRVIEERLLYRRAGREVPIRVHFTSPGYAPLAELVDVLRQAHVAIKEMSVAPGEDQRDTIHLLLDLPRGLDAAKLTALIGELHEVRTVRVE